MVLDWSGVLDAVISEWYSVLWGLMLAAVVPGVISSILPQLLLLPKATSDYRKDILKGTVIGARGKGGKRSCPHIAAQYAGGKRLVSETQPVRCMQGHDSWAALLTMLC